MGLTKEDWERVHLNDQMYIKEMEYLEMEHYKNGEKPPAKIILKDEKQNSKKNSKRNSSRINRYERK